MNLAQRQRVETAIAAFKQGQFVILTDAVDREHEGDLICPAQTITAAKINFMITHGRGLVCMPMAPEFIERLDLPMMTDHNRSKYGTGFTRSIGLASGIGSGISPGDRAKTVQVAIADDTQPDDIVMPGHIFPLKAQPMGVLARRGHTEGSVDLARLASFKPAAVLCEIINDDGTMARGDSLKHYAQQHQIPILAIEDLRQYRLCTENLVTEVASAQLPVANHGDFTIKVFKSMIDDNEHVALIAGDLRAQKSPLVRLHSECLTGDVFHSRRCDCGWQLEQSLKKLSQAGGVLLYMRQEGRGIGLANKIKAYALQQQQGMDTVEANKALGFAADLRDYTMSAQIIRALKLAEIQLLTNNPAKAAGIEACGIKVSKQVAVEMAPHESNRHYLQTKKNKLGHQLHLEEA